MTSYLIFVMTMGGVYALLALSLNLVWGMAGMVNLGLAGFFALGAYTTSILTKAGALISVGILAAVVVGILAGLLVTFATLRLRDDYLAIVTLGFAEVLRLIALNERWLTGGADGISGVPAPFAPLAGATFSLAYLILVTLAALLVFAILDRLDRSPFGRALKSIREDQQLAAFAGKRVLPFKFKAFGLSAAIATLAGALYVHRESYISPDYFEPEITVYIFLAVTAGGIGRPVSAALGGYAVIMFLEVTRLAAGVIPGISAVQAAAAREMMVGAALVVLLLIRPAGLLPEQVPRSGTTNRRKL